MTPSAVYDARLFLSSSRGFYTVTYDDKDGSIAISSNEAHFRGIHVSERVTVPLDAAPALAGLLLKIAELNGATEISA